LKRRRKYNCRNQFHTHSDKDKKGNTENKELKKERKNYKQTSAQAFGRTRRPIRPASLALSTFSNNGTTVDFKLLSLHQGKL